jgi:hypothetical protein
MKALSASIKVGISILIFTAIFLFSPREKAMADATCTVEPFTTKITQGEDASISLIIKVDKETSPLSVAIGDLPFNVEGGFPQTESVGRSGLEKILKIQIRANPNAQTGSFMIPVLYSSGKNPQSICQFNLKISKGGDKSATTTPALYVVKNVSIRNIFQRFWSWIVSLASPHDK